MLEMNETLTPDLENNIEDQTPQLAYEADPEIEEIVTPRDPEEDIELKDEIRNPDIRAYNEAYDQRERDKADEELESFSTEAMSPEDIEEDAGVKEEWLKDYIKKRNLEGNNLLGAYLTNLHTRPKDQDGFDYKDFITDYAKIHDLVENLPEATAKAALGVADGVLNTFGALMTNLSTYGEIDWDESYTFRSMLPDTDNPVRTFFTEVAEWFMPAKYLGTFKKGAALSKQLAASATATWLSADVDKESSFKMLAKHPKFLVLKHEYLKWAIENDDDAYLLKRLKHTLQDEVLLPGGLLVGLGVPYLSVKLAPKALHGIAKILQNGFNLSKLKEAFTAKRALAYIRDEEGSILSGLDPKRNASSIADKFKTSREDLSKRLDESDIVPDVKSDLKNTASKASEGIIGNKYIDDLEQNVSDLQKKIDDVELEGTKIDADDEVVQKVLASRNRIVSEEDYLRKELTRNNVELDDTWEEALDEVLGEVKSKRPTFENPKNKESLSTKLAEEDQVFDELVRNRQYALIPRVEQARLKLMQAWDEEKLYRNSFILDENKNINLAVHMDDYHNWIEALNEYAILPEETILKRLLNSRLKFDEDYDLLIEALPEEFIKGKSPDKIVQFLSGTQNIKNMRGMVEDEKKLLLNLHALQWYRDRREVPGFIGMVPDSDIRGKVEWAPDWLLDDAGTISSNEYRALAEAQGNRHIRKRSLYEEMKDHNRIAGAAHRLKLKRKNTPKEEHVEKEYKVDPVTKSWDNTDETVDEILHTKTKDGKHLLDLADPDELKEEIQTAYRFLKKRLAEKYKKKLPKDIGDLEPTLDNMYMLDELIEEVEKSKKGIILKHLKETIFKDRKDIGEGIIQDFATITDDGIVIDIHNYTNLDDYWKAVNKISKNKESIDKIESEYGRKLAVQRRGADPIKDDLVDSMYGVTPFTKEELLTRIMNRPLGQALNEVELAVGTKIIHGTYIDIGRKVEVLTAEMEALGKKLSDAPQEKLHAFQENIELLQYEIIPSFVAGGGTEHGRGLRAWRVTGAKDLAFFAKHTAEAMEGLGGKENVAAGLSVFSQMVKEGPDMIKRASKIANGMKLHWVDRIKNAVYILRANNLIGTTKSLTYNTGSNLLVLNKLNLDMHMDVALQLIRGNHGELNRPHIQDIVALWGTVVPAAINGSIMAARHAWKIINPFANPGTLLKGKIHERLQARDAKFFHTIDPKDGLSADHNFWQRFKEKPTDAIGDNLATLFEKIVHFSTYGLMGLKTQGAIDDVARVIIGTQIKGVQAARKARTVTASYPTRSFWDEFTRFYDNPTDDMLREQANFGDIVTQTMPITEATSPWNSAILNGLLRNKKISLFGVSLADIGKITVPFATPILNMSKTLITSNLIGGRVHRYLTRNNLKLTEAQKQSKLAGEFVGSIALGSFLYQNSRSNFLTGSPPSNQDEKKLLESLGVQWNSMILDDPDNPDVKKYYKIDRLEPWGRLLNLTADFQKAYEQFDDDEYSEALHLVNKALLNNLGSGLVYDYISYWNEISHYYGSEKRERRSGAFWQTFFSKVVADFVPFRGLMAEQRKQIHPVRVLVNSGNKAIDADKFNKFVNKRSHEESVEELNQFEKNITFAEEIVKQLMASIPGRHQEVAVKYNVFGSPVLIPNEFRTNPGFSFSIPTPISLWLKTSDLLSLKEVSFHWQKPVQTSGFDINKLNEIGNWILSEDDVKLNEAARQIASAMKEQYGDWTNEGTEKEIRIFLELYALRQADEQLGKIKGADRESNIKLWEPTQTIRIDTNPTDEETFAGNSITLGPELYGKFLKTMNSVTPKGHVGNFKEALYSEIMAGYPTLGDKQYTLGRHPKLKFKRLSSIYRDYRKAGDEEFRETNGTLFKTFMDWQKSQSVNEEIEANEPGLIDVKM
jgi:hypothetical protein